MDYLEKLEKIENVFEEELIGNGKFLLRISEGMVVPVDSPNFYNGLVEIVIVKSFSEISLCQIGENEYKITQQALEKIEKFVRNNFSKLLNIALSQNSDIYVGGYSILWIKVGSVIMKINESNLTTEQDMKYIYEFKNQIIDIIKKQ